MGGDKEKVRICMDHESLMRERKKECRVCRS